ncbi:MAG: Ferric-anguibactin receptor FatA [Luteibacter sp.]|uniref:hypothetical protein n=1 Tax=Luteibacter sp. TaxID=1886636 RepID=UPI0013801550|nr:hypothetical protein [Luteibacter sp.]KAF1003193.1 MAG: Ferric-anguibactin receptor FatA [Luteibacter sp.]
MGRRFGETGEWGVRFNGRYQNGETPRDGNSRRTSLAALALDYRGRDLRVALDLISQSYHDNRAPTKYYLANYQGTAVPSAPDLKINATDPSAWSTEKMDSVQVTTEYDISSNWQIFAGAGQSRIAYDSIDPYEPLVDNIGTTKRSFTSYHAPAKKESYRAGIRGQLETGPVLHKMVFSADWYRNKISTLYAPALGVVPDGNIYLPAVPLALQFGQMQENSTAASSFRSIVLADTLSTLNDRV